MATSTEGRRALALWLLLAAGCVDPQMDVLLDRATFQSDAAEFVCSSGEKVAVAANLIGNVRACLGLACGAEPGSSTCTSKATNPVVGTCVAEFFSCYTPSGACTEGGPGLSFANGARLQGGWIDARLYPPGAETPCIQVQKTGFGSPEERTWLRATDVSAATPAP